MTIYKELSEERKYLQDIGELPVWVTTNSYQMLKEKYLDEGETLRQRFKKIAYTAAQYLPDEGRGVFMDKFFNILWNGWLAASTPVLANMGKEKGCPVSCSGSYIGDSVYDFYSTQLETAILSKNGFGTSGYLGDIRPRGAPINGMKGGASGIVPVFKDFVQLSRDISQGSSRRGAWAGYVPIDHNDFHELLTFISKYPDDANLGWIVSDSFIDRLNSGDSEAIERYQKALKLKMITGKGYFFFVDKVNRLNPQCYKDKGLKVLASQLCVAPETRILTDVGYKEISQLEGSLVNVWNGEEFSKVKIIKTSESQELLKITFSSGQELECTPYHKFYIYQKGKSGFVEKRAHELNSGDKLIKFNLPVLHGKLKLDNAYANGFYSGDGCLSRNTQLIYLYGDKRKLQHLFEDIANSVYVQEHYDRVIIRTNKLLEKFYVPTCEYTIQSRLEWLSGISDSDGCLAVNGRCKGIQIGNINKEFLLSIQEMLQTLGIESKVTKARDESFNLLPENNVDRTYKLYKTKPLYRLLINTYNLKKLIDLGFTTKRLDISGIGKVRQSTQYIKVTNKEYTKRVDSTFCFTEPKRHMGMFNGVLTGNCTEITLYSNPEESYTCVLSSLNLSKYDEWKFTDTVFVATVFLHCVALNFIEIAKDIPGLERAVLFTKKNMALGLGALGFHTYLQDNSIPLESFEAHLFNQRVFQEIDEKSLEASKWLVDIFGECENTSGYGVANTHRLAVAPNLSSALICGGVSQG